MHPRVYRASPPPLLPIHPQGGGVTGTGRSETRDMWLPLAPTRPPCAAVRRPPVARHPEEPPPPPNTYVGSRRSSRPCRSRLRRSRQHRRIVLRISLPPWNSAVLRCLGAFHARPKITCAACVEGALHGVLVPLPSAVPQWPSQHYGLNLQLSPCPTHLPPPPPPVWYHVSCHVCCWTRVQHNTQHMQPQEGKKSLSRAEHGPRRLSQKICGRSL